MSQSRHDPMHWHDRKFEGRVYNMFGPNYFVGQDRLLRPSDVRVRFPFGALFAIFGLFLILKLIAVVAIGADDFEVQRDALSQGSLPEKIGAALLQIDPITAKIAELFTAR